MALILTRSPYLVSRSDLDEGASLIVEIGDYNADTSGFEVEKTFTFNYRNAYFIDVSPFLNDYLGASYQYEGSLNGYISDRSGNRRNLRYCRITLGGEKAGVAQSDVVTEHFITRGYLYSTDDFNKDFSSELDANANYAGSSDVIYKLDDSDLLFPLLKTSENLIGGGLSNTDVQISFLNNGDVFSTGTYTLTPDYSEFMMSKVDVPSFVEWGEDSDMIDEETICSERFLRNNPRLPLDKIIIHSNGVSKVLEVKSIDSCKYNPYRLKFKNRYGVYEYLWFFKKSVKSISINKESFRGNSLPSYSAGDGVKTYNNFNTNGKETMVLNSDWVDERMNESFRQLMLSEDVELYDFDTKETYSVNIITSDLTFKTHLNDKVINYEIEVEFAHEVINNVG